MKSIMVPVADRPECEKALINAFELAKQHAGNVVGYHVRPHRKEVRPTKGGPAGSSRQYSWEGQTSEKQIELYSKNAQRLFAQLSEKYGFSMTSKPKLSKEGGLSVWHNVTGDLDHAFSIIGPMSDLIVVSRPKSKRSVKARAFAKAALLRSGRPILLLPQKRLKTLGRKVLIAWNQSEQVAATVMASIPLLKNAESVTIVCALHHNHLGPGLNHLLQYLRLRGIKAKVVKTTGILPRDEIVQTYIDVDADLLMMGAFSRSYWREQVFGGMTQYMLDSVQIPTVMMHK